MEQPQSKKVNKQKIKKKEMTILSFQFATTTTKAQTQFPELIFDSVKL